METHPDPGARAERRTEHDPARPARRSDPSRRGRLGVRTRMIDPALARAIRLVVLDVDGVLTDGGIYLGAVDGQPLEFKRYDIQDGLGIYLMQKAGLRVAIITGRVSESVRLRAAELGIEDVAQDPNAQKLPAFLSMLDQHGIRPSEAAFIGDDFPDMAVLRLVGLPVAVGNAVPEVKNACDAAAHAHRRCRRRARVRRAAAQGARRMGPRHRALRRERSLPIRSRHDDVRPDHRARQERRAARARSTRHGRGAARRELRRGGHDDRAIDGARDRDRRGQVRADRPQDRRDAHVHRHARDVPASNGQRARRPRHRRHGTTSRSCSPSPASRTSCSDCSNICRASVYGPSPSRGRWAPRWRGCATLRSMRGCAKRRARTISRRPPAPRRHSHSAMRSRSRCSSTRDFAARISRGCILAVRSVVVS